jgi:hypothetical protein
VCKKIKSNEQTRIIDELDEADFVDVNRILSNTYKFFNDKLNAQNGPKLEKTVRDDLKELLTTRLRTKNLILVKFNDKHELVSAEKCIRQLSSFETIPGFIYKLPNRCSKDFWALFHLLGASDTVTAHRCRQVLDSFYELTERLEIRKNFFLNFVFLFAYLLDQNNKGF